MQEGTIVQQDIDCLECCWQPLRRNKCRKKAVWAINEFHQACVEHLGYIVLDGDTVYEIKGNTWI